MTLRYRHTDLVALAETLFLRAGLDDEKAEAAARILVEADLLGHTTHGIALCPDYVEEIEAGDMAPEGEPAIVVDRAAVAVWDGRRLPGPWLVERAIAAASAKARVAGTGMIVIRRSHHIACLAAFLERPARDGLMVTIASSDPAAASVVPFGGVSPLISPDPIAVGIPTTGDPILIDISASITTNAMCGRVGREGGRLPGPWLIGPDGRASDEPAILKGDPPGALLPAGGLDHGHKGYGLALTIEALTQGLSAFGRADSAQGWGASVYVQILDPTLFGGLDAFARQTGWLANACRRATPADPQRPVRLPGEAGLARKRDTLVHGVPLRGDAVDALRRTAERLKVDMPEALP